MSAILKAAQLQRLTKTSSMRLLLNSLRWTMPKSNTPLFRIGMPGIPKQGPEGSLILSRNEAAAQATVQKFLGRKLKRALQLRGNIQAVFCKGTNLSASFILLL